MADAVAIWANATGPHIIIIRPFLEYRTIDVLLYKLHTE